MKSELKLYILGRLKEQSTWRAFGVALGAFGVTLDEESLVAIGLGLAALIGILLPD